MDSLGVLIFLFAEKTSIMIQNVDDELPDKKISKFLMKNDIEVTEIRRGKPGKK